MKMYLSASQNAQDVDLLMLVLTLVCTLVALSIIFSVIYFCIKYHSSKDVPRKSDTQSLTLEFAWTIITLCIFMGFFYWGSHLYKRQVKPTKADYDIFIVAKRWMWVYYHPNGFTEINNLHLPLKKKIRFTMISEDVIHSFFLPNFRIKQDILPDYFTSLSIEPLKEGDTSIFCAEYCGTEHSQMKGHLTVLPEKDYLSLVGAQSQTESLAQKGKILFEEHGCISCHSKDSTSAPTLYNLYGNKVVLDSGGVVADDQYIRQSILYPMKQKVKGYEPVMPSYKDQLKEKELRELIEYIKTLRTP